MKNVLNWEPEIRPEIAHEMPIYESRHIHTGDLFLILRLDGIDPLISYGTGSRAGHTAVAMWFDDGQLYIVES